MATLLQELDERSSQIRFEVIDFSAGELIRLHENREVNIQPEFQRMFRWTDVQQSRLIESMLLGLPVPQIVLFQREDGILELIDGLQRVSSLIRFMTGKSPGPSDQDVDSPPSWLAAIFSFRSTENSSGPWTQFFSWNLSGKR